MGARRPDQGPGSTGGRSASVKGLQYFSGEEYDSAGWGGGLCLSGSESYRLAPLGGSTRAGVGCLRASADPLPNHP